MSYEELTALPKAERQEYVESLQQLFTEIEGMDKKRQPANFIDDLFGADEENQIDMASLAPGMPSLNRQGKVECRGRVPGSSTMLVPFRVKAASPAPKAPASVRIWFRELIGIQQPVPESPKDFICRALLAETFDTAGCEKGFVPALARWKQTLPNGIKQNFRYTCFTENSFNTIPKDRRDEMQRNVKDIIARDRAQDRTRKLSQRRPVAKQVSHSLLRSNPKRKVPPSAALSLEDETVSIPAAVCENSQDSIGHFPEEPDAKACNDKSISEFREKFYRGPDNLCIYGGNLGQYANGEKKAGGCSPHNQFCVQSLDCKNSATGERWKPTFQCGNDQIICNPLLFGIQSDGKTPFCVARGPHATAYCEAASGNATQGSWEEISGMREAWNLFSESFNKLCAPNSDGAKFFCRECHTMKRRMFYINASARKLSRCHEIQDGVNKPRRAIKASGAQ